MNQPLSTTLWIWIRFCKHWAFASPRNYFLTFTLNNRGPSVRTISIFDTTSYHQGRTQTCTCSSVPQNIINLSFHVHSRQYLNKKSNYCNMTRKFPLNEKNMFCSISLQNKNYTSPLFETNFPLSRQIFLKNFIFLKIPNLHTFPCLKKERLIKCNTLNRSALNHFHRYLRKVLIFETLLTSSNY